MNRFDSHGRDGQTYRTSVATLRSAQLVRGHAMKP